MIIIGDLHGGYPEILHKIKKLRLNNTSFIQVGDWGLGFQQRDLDIRALSQIDRSLTAQGNHLYILRGNHDNKWFWDHRDDFSFQNIQLVQDYEVQTIDGRKVLFVGGGISIDRINRIPGISYWEDEVVLFNEPLLLSACAGGVDIMISHIAPKEVWPFTFTPLVLNFITREMAAGKDLAADLDYERKIMSRIYEHVKAAGCTEWYYGHYHEAHYEEKERIHFRCVTIQEMYAPQYS